METILITGCIFFLGGLVQGVTGFGSALVAIPLLCIFIDIKFAIPLSVLNSLIITFYLALKLKTLLDTKKLLPLCLSTLPGILFGVTLLKKVDSKIIALLLGILIISYSLYNLFSRQKPQNLHHYWSYIAGFCSGAIGSAFSAGGPPVIIYTTLKGWNKDEIKATLTGFFLFNSCMTVAAHSITGLITRETLVAFLYSAPFVLGGTVLGSFCYGFFRSETYMKTIYIFLVLIGIMMIIIKT
jgi:uncharacterized membrane protein YfcA